MKYKNCEKFSSELKSVMDFIENVLSNEHPVANISLDYFLLAILEIKDCSANKLLESCLTDTTLDTIHDVYYDKIKKKSLTSIRPNRELKINSEFSAILDMTCGDEENDKKIDTSDVILTILNPETNGKLKEILTNDVKLDSDSIRKVFQRAGSGYSILYTAKDVIPKNNIKECSPKKEKNSIKAPIGHLEIVNMNNFEEYVGGFQTKLGKKTNAIESYCTNLNEMVRNGKIDRIVGRSREFREMIKVLCRRNKNNAIVVGPEGCGKSAICKGLAYLIENGEVPQQISDKTVLMLNQTSLVAGTTYRGMLEERIKQLFDEITKSSEYILFIDDISNTFTDKQKSDNNSSTMWNEILEGGNIQIIGTASFKDYRNTFDSNPSIGHKFQKIIIDTPSFDETLKILDGIKDYYENFHNIEYTEESIFNCVKLAEKYITDRNLPDSAIDLMDEAGAYININSDDYGISELKKEYKKITKEINVLKLSDKWEDADEKDKELKKVKIKILEKEKELKKYRENNKIKVYTDTIYNVVSDKTGIPITKLSVNDKERLSNIDSVLKSKIIGQDDAIEKVCRSIKRNRVGITNNKTYASFLMIGKTGVGKTLLAKQLAKEIFGDEKLLVRFDMSEYSDKTSVSKLIGSNPGYVGYENGGLLTEAIKNKKHCVLLLDEIEKADKEVYNLFLQVFDEGFLTDNSGQRIDFKNVIIIITSNVGAKMATEFSKGIGFNNDEDDNRNHIISKEVKKKFPPEFLNRLNSVILFNSLNDSDYMGIIRLELDKLNERMSELGYSMSYSDDIVEKIFEGIKDEREYGARPIMREIQNKIEDNITDLIIDDDSNIKGFNIIVEDGLIKVNKED